MTNLTKRVITALVLATLVLSVIFAFPGAPTRTFFTAFLLLAIWEWGGFLGRGVALRTAFLLGGVLLGLAINFVGNALYFFGYPLADMLLRIAVAWWSLLAIMLFTRPISYGHLLTGLAGYLCIIPAWIALLMFLSLENGAWLFIWLVAMVAAADIGAYFTGKRFGRRKLAPEISPGKTREGLAGGLCAAAIVAAAGAAALQLSVPLWFVLGPVIALVSVLGDLTVSAFKRNAGLKDTGRILPGHGGVLDRIDSLVAAAPVFALILSFSVS